MIAIDDLPDLDPNDFVYTANGPDVRSTASRPSSSARMNDAFLVSRTNSQQYSYENLKKLAALRRERAKVIEKLRSLSEQKEVLRQEAKKLEAKIVECIKERIQKLENERKLADEQRELSNKKRKNLEHEITRLKKDQETSFNVMNHSDYWGSTLWRSLILAVRGNSYNRRAFEENLAALRQRVREVEEKKLELELKRSALFKEEKELDVKISECKTKQRNYRLYKFYFYRNKSLPKSRDECPKSEETAAEASAPILRPPSEASSRSTFSDVVRCLSQLLHGPVSNSAVPHRSCKASILLAHMPRTANAQERSSIKHRFRNRIAPMAGEAKKNIFINCLFSIFDRHAEQ